MIEEMGEISAGFEKTGTGGVHEGVPLSSLSGGMRRFKDGERGGPQNAASDRLVQITP
jgi:hypothetical protein